MSAFYILGLRLDMATPWLAAMNTHRNPSQFWWKKIELIEFGFKFFPVFKFGDVDEDNFANADSAAPSLLNHKTILFFIYIYIYHCCPKLYLCYDCCLYISFYRLFYVYFRGGVGKTDHAGARDKFIVPSVFKGRGTKIVPVVMPIWVQHLYHVTLHSLIANVTKNLTWNNAVL